MSATKPTLYEVALSARSVCCGAAVVVDSGQPDFAGDDPAACVTCWFVCNACGQPCDSEAR